MSVDSPILRGVHNWKARFSGWNPFRPVNAKSMVAANTTSQQISQPVSDEEARRRTKEIFFNVVLALFFLQFAIRHAVYAMDVFRWSTMLLMVKVMTDVIFYLIRRVPKDVSMSLYDWMIAIAGTYFVMFLLPVENANDLWFGQVLQFTGWILQILAMFSLNRSIGMVAANRGVQTTGLYGLVRHPLYLSYFVAFLGYVLNHYSVMNLMVYAVAVGLWVLRLLAEEKFLMQSDEYRQYAQKVRWRMLPGVF